MLILACSFFVAAAIAFYAIVLMCNRIDCKHYQRLIDAAIKEHKEVSDILIASRASCQAKDSRIEDLESTIDSLQGQLAKVRVWIREAPVMEDC